VSTETELKNWRNGQTQAERMCADLLALQAFDDIDPQAPLGGGDGKKDILCSKNGIRYVAAAYFPTTEKTYSEIERKFLDDLEGVKANKRAGSPTRCVASMLSSSAAPLGEKSGLAAISSGKSEMARPEGFEPPTLRSEV
jgi:hypothetical protein